MNTVHLIGNVGQDPEMKQITSGQLANVSLATSKKFKTRDGEKKEETQWHRLVVFGKLADVVAQYVNKGDKLAITGEIQYRSWDAEDGTKKYMTEIVVRDLEMLGSRNNGSGQGDGRRQPVAANSPPVDSGGDSGFADTDDLPFN